MFGIMSALQKEWLTGFIVHRLHGLSGVKRGCAIVILPNRSSAPATPGRPKTENKQAKSEGESEPEDESDETGAQMSLLHVQLDLTAIFNSHNLRVSPFTLVFNEQTVYGSEPKRRVKL